MVYVCGLSRGLIALRVIMSWYILIAGDAIKLNGQSSFLCDGRFMDICYIYSQLNAKEGPIHF